MVLMPPGSAKSTYVSVVFPVWWFIQHPRSSIIAVSHTASLVQSFGRRAQMLIEEHEKQIGFGIAQGGRTVASWRTTAGGEYFAAGVHGAVTGRRADLLIIDDPIKSMAEADSAKHRRAIWNWYTAELATRLKPDARVALVMTRWHEKDLGGELLDAAAENWTVLSLPALARQDDPLGRPAGAPLWPDWEGTDALALKQSLVGERVWSALFQQLPRPDGGQFFQTDALTRFDADLTGDQTPIRSVRAWDLAATAAGQNPDADWTVGLKLALLNGRRFVIEDVVRVQQDVNRVRDLIVSTARADGFPAVVSLPIDPGQAGKSQIAHLSSLLPGYRVYTSREQGTKLSRAMPVATQIANGTVSIRPGGWHRDFLEELRAFPGGRKDDQVDALSRAFATLAELEKASRRAFIPLTAR